MALSMYYHFSLDRLNVGTVLEGRKYMHKRRQRVGQRHVDEAFEAVRKREFPSAPSLFTSLWTSSTFDPSIPRKAFAEDRSAEEGVLYEVEPVGTPYRVEPHWEIEACRAVTQSGLRGAALARHVAALARRFWRPEVVERRLASFLAPDGARIVREVRVLRGADAQQDVRAEQVAERLDVHALERVAEQMLAGATAPVVRHRLMRDVLRLPPDVPALRAARDEAMKSRCVRELAREQRGDGGWGRFHSKDYAASQRTPTTEAAVDRAVELGIGAAHPMAAKVTRHIRRILRGELPFPDPPEKNERWPTGARLFAASTLARIEPDAREIDPVWSSWNAVISRAFARGRYDPRRERQAHRELHGITGELRYLQLRNKYAVILLGTRSADLDPAVSRAYGAYLWARPDGIGYIDAPLQAGPTGRRALGWFSSTEFISRFAGWREAARGVITKLWRNLCSEGALDFGPIPHGARLSDDLRDRLGRRREWTLRALVLLRRYLDEREDAGRIMLAPAGTAGAVGCASEGSTKRT